MIKFEEKENKVYCIKDSDVEISATFETLPKNLDTITIEWWVEINEKLKTSISYPPQLSYVVPPLVDSNLQICDKKYEKSRRKVFLLSFQNFSKAIAHICERKRKVLGRPQEIKHFCGLAESWNSD